MIVRIWRGQAERGKAPIYLKHVTERVLPALKGIPGHMAGCVVQREADERIEFVVMTYWESWDAIRSFAGDELDAAVLEPEARAVLCEFDDFVSHVELVCDAQPEAHAAAPRDRSDVRPELRPTH